MPYLLRSRLVEYWLPALSVRECRLSSSGTLTSSGTWRQTLCMNLLPCSTQRDQGNTFCWAQCTRPLIDHMPARKSRRAWLALCFSPVCAARKLNNLCPPCIVGQQLQRSAVTVRGVAPPKAWHCSVEGSQRPKAVLTSKMLRSRSPRTFSAAYKVDSTCNRTRPLYNC